MRGSRYDRILASTALALILAAPFGGVARDLDVVAGEPATKLAAVPMATEHAQTQCRFCFCSRCSTGA